MPNVILERRSEKVRLQNALDQAHCDAELASSNEEYQAAWNRIEKLEAELASL